MKFDLGRRRPEEVNRLVDPSLSGHGLVPLELVSVTLVRQLSSLHPRLGRALFFSFLSAFSMLGSVFSVGGRVRARRVSGVRVMSVCVGTLSCPFRRSVLLSSPRARAASREPVCRWHCVFCYSATYKNASQCVDRFTFVFVFGTRTKGKEARGAREKARGTREEREHGLIAAESLLQASRSHFHPTPPTRRTQCFSAGSGSGAGA